MSTLANTFPVGDKYSCRILFDPGRREVKSYWAPCPPPKMTRKMERDYRRGRDELLSQTGLTIFVAAAQ
jgi:hypothetical protein